MSATPSTTERRCSKCHRLTAGHGGKYGPACGKEPLVLDPATNQYVEPPSTHTVDKPEVPVTGTEEFATPSATVGGGFTYPSQTCNSSAQAGIPPPGLASHTSVSHMAEGGAEGQRGSEQTTNGATGGSEQTTDSSRQAQNVSVANTMTTMAVTMTTGVSYTTVSSTMPGMGQLLNPIQMVGQYSQAPVAHTVPIWSTMVRARARPAVPVPQAPPRAQSMDINQLAQQLADMQCQLARLQSSSGPSIDHSQQLGAAAGAAVITPQVRSNPAQAGLASVAGSIYGFPRYPVAAAAPMGIPVQGMPPPPVAGPPPAPPGVVPGLVDIDNLGDLHRFNNTDGLSDRTLRSALRGWYIDLQELLPVVSYYGEESSDLTPTIDPVSAAIMG